MSLYQLNDTVKVSTLFTVGGTPTNPTAVSLTLTTPAGSALSYGTGDITQAGTGSYYINYYTQETGLHVYKWVGTGAAPGVYEGSFLVSDSLTTDPGLTTVDQVKMALEINHTNDDELILAYIMSASDLIQTEYEREFTKTNNTTRTFRVYDKIVDLAPYEIRSIGTATLHAGQSEATVLTTADYVLEPIPSKYGTYYIVNLSNDLDLDSDYKADFGFTTLQITGDWGMANVPTIVNRACVLTVISWLRPDNAFNPIAEADRQTAVSPQSTFAIPLAARRLLDSFRRIGAM